MSCAAQAVVVCASETNIGGAYIAVVTESAPALPEVPDVEEEAEVAEEAPIAPPGDCPVFITCLVHICMSVSIVGDAWHACSCVIVAMLC